MSSSKSNEASVVDSSTSTDTVDPSTLKVDVAEVFEKDVESLTPEDIANLQEFYRADRERFAELERKTKSVGRKKGTKSKAKDETNDTSNPLDVAVGVTS